MVESEASRRNEDGMDGIFEFKTCQVSSRIMMCVGSSMFIVQYNLGECCVIYI